MTTDADVQEFEVYDRDRAIQFRGTELAFVTSARDDKDRWIEMRAFLTEGGMYIIAGEGKSHLPGERTRCFVYQCDTAEAVVDQLYKRDDSGTWYLTNIARQLLEATGRVDADVERAYRVERVA